MLRNPKIVEIFLSISAELQEQKLDRDEFDQLIEGV
jgi:hypothetical protein